jgi:hypothetical protein
MDNFETAEDQVELARVMIASLREESRTLEMDTLRVMKTVPFKPYMPRVPTEAQNLKLKEITTRQVEIKVEIEQYNNTIYLLTH